MAAPTARRRFGPVVALVLPALLSACGAEGIDIAGLAGSSSMQIDVEVYKGPLSKELDVQKSELLAKIYESEDALATLTGQTRIAMCALACFDRRGEERSHKRYPVVKSDRDSVFTPYDRPQVLAPDKKMYRHEDAKAFCARRIHDIEIEASADEQHDVCPVLDVMEFELRALKGRYHLLGLGHIEEVFGALPNDHRECVEIGNQQYLCLDPEARQLSLDSMNNLEDPIEFLSKVVTYAELLRSKSAFVATQQTAIEPKSKRARRAIVNYAQFLADYGNQIGARADAILKQKALFRNRDDPTGRERGTMLARELLANTAYLRDSAPTGYLNLYKFNDASAANTRHEATDRIRLVEQLTADTYWTRINAVFAAGQGDVTMAFIKDDIGNWDLKKFDNRPGQLVDAYKSAGLAVLQEVASAATGTAGIEGAGRLLRFADRINFGGGVASNAQVDAQVERLRQRTTSRLEALKTSEQARHAELTEAIGAATAAAAETEEQLTTLTATAATSRTERDEAAAAARQAREALAALEGERRGLEEARADAQPESTIDEKIATLNDRIALQRTTLETAEALVEVRDQKHALDEAALAATQERLDEQNAALAALMNREAVFLSETARFTRQILDNYLATLEELAEASAAAPAAEPILPVTN